MSDRETQEIKSKDVEQLDAYEPSKEEKNFLNEFSPTQVQRLRSTIEDPGATMRLKTTAQSIAGMVDNPQPIQDVILHDVRIEDYESGEVRQCVRSILVTPDGVAFAATSDGVLQSLQQLGEIYGPPPWKPAIMLELVTQETKRGFTVYNLIPVEG